MRLSEYSYLNNFLPENSVDFVIEILKKNQVKLKITKERQTKLGDYKFSKFEGHKITINENLNTDEFLLVMLHEIAHLLVFNQFKNRIKPHGIEWKSSFTELLQRAIELDCFSSNILDDLNNYILNGFTPSTKEKLYKKIRKSNGDLIYLEDIPLNSIFTVNKNRTFIKLEKLKKRYKCQDIKNKRMYLVHPQTIVLSFE